MVYREEKRDLDLDVVVKGSETQSRLVIHKNLRYGSPQQDSFSAVSDEARLDHISQGIQINFEGKALALRVRGVIEEEQFESRIVRLSFPGESPSARVLVCALNRRHFQTSAVLSND